MVQGWFVAREGDQRVDDRTVYHSGNVVWTVILIESWSWNVHSNLTACIAVLHGDMRIR